MTQRQDQFDDDQLPQGLKVGLNELYGAKVSVPEDVDQAVLAHAREVFAQRQRDRLRLRWVGAAAAAAAVAISIVTWRAFVATPQPGQNVVAQSRDLTGDGQVNILDAFALARRIEAATPSSQYDFNGDGAVNQGDVNALAAAAVTLSKEQI